MEKCVRLPLHPVAKPAAFLDFNEAIAVDIIFLDIQEKKANLALNMGGLWIVLLSSGSPEEPES